MSKKFPQDVIARAKVISNGWAEINPELTFGDLSQAGLHDQIDTVVSIENEIITLEAKLTNLRNERDAAYDKLWDYAKRGRMGIKVFYGDDSSQYEMVGGTRYSDRKPIARKAATVA